MYRASIDADDLPRRIGVAWRDLRRQALMPQMRERLLDGVVEPAQLDVLDVLASKGQARMHELASALRVDASTTTRALIRLERAGLAERQVAPEDGRGVLAVPTERGRELHATLAKRRVQLLAEVLVNFDKSERVVLAELLERLVAGVDAAIAPDEPSR